MIYAKEKESIKTICYVIACGYSRAHLCHILHNSFTSIVIRWFYLLWQPLYPIDGLRERFCGLCVLNGTRFLQCNNQKR